MGSSHKFGFSTVLHWSKFTIPIWGAFALIILAGGGGSYAAHLENNDSFCASCHTEPESEYYNRSQADTPVDLASWHTTKDTRCIDCHSGEGVTGRVSAMALGAGDLFRYLTDTATQPAPLTSPITDAHCLKCHADVPETQNFQQHFHAFLDDWQGIDPNAAGCVDCHSAHTTDATDGLGFLNQQRTAQVCQSCHRVAGEGPRN